MKTSTAVALLLLASPLLAAMNTYSSTSTFTTGSVTTNKVGVAADGSNTRIYVQFMSVPDYPVTGTDKMSAFCFYAGVPGASTTSAADWMGSDLGIYPFTSADTTATTPAWTAGTVVDTSCKGTTASSNTCSIDTAADAGQNWAWASTASSIGDKFMWDVSAHTATIEIGRPNAAADSGVDQAITPASFKLLLAYITMKGSTAQTCATSGDVSFPTDQNGMTGALSTSSGSSSTGSGSSFGSTVYLSWIALLISYALLN